MADNLEDQLDEILERVTEDFDSYSTPDAREHSRQRFMTVEEAKQKLLTLLNEARAKELQRIWKTAVDNDVAGAVKWELEDRIADLTKGNK